MKHANHFLPAVVALAALVEFAGSAGAQETDPDQIRARELVQRIRKSMREIDSLLLKGAQPDKIVEELAANQKRIEELLKETESKSESVVNSIDELVKLTKYQQQGKGGGGGPPPPEGKPRDSSSMPQREKSPESGDLQPQPKPEGGQPQEEQPKPEDGDPKSGGPDSKSPEQQDARRPPPPGATGEFERTDVSGRWGVLPPKEAEDLQRRNADEFPQRYRRWMELYFQRVNKLPPRDN